MLSLLSLLLASGTVLRADTEEWTPQTYPDPRTNHTLCNTWANSTLCDPDHILTDQWRVEINDNIIRQVEKLKNANILYNDNAPPECYENTTETVQIYVILAKRIQTTSNQTITNAELIEFGDKLAEEYDLNDQICKNYLLLIGVEAAKSAYTRTGSSLKLPEDLMIRIYNQSENVFKEKNYMEGLNKMIEELGEQMMDPFKYETTTVAATEVESTTPEMTTEDPSFNISTSVELIWTNISTTQAPKEQRAVLSWWMFGFLSVSIISSVIILIIVLISKKNSFKTLQMQTVIPMPNAVTKSNCPSDDNNSDKFATITIPRRKIDLESTLQIEGEREIRMDLENEEGDRDSVASCTNHYCITEALNNNIVIKESPTIGDPEILTTPALSRSPACFRSFGPVQINADHLSTDIVVSHLSSSSCTSERVTPIMSPKNEKISTTVIKVNCLETI